MKDNILNFYHNNMLTINISLIIIIILVAVFSYIFRKQIKQIYIKNTEIINYVIVGALTTLVSISSYWLLRFIIKDYVVLSILSWICAVIFAYITNRKFVFESKENYIMKEMIKFVSCRLTTLGIEVVLMILFVSIFKINDMVSKVILQVVVLVLNYIFSKLFVFKGGKK